MYRDEKSGATTDRPGLRRALADAATGRFDIILDDLDRAGVRPRSATEPIDTGSSVGRMLVQMLGVFAQFERDVIIDRVIAGMERKAASGRWTGGTRPYGYQVDSLTDTLVPHPAEAAILRQIFVTYAESRVGPSAIAARLNGRGVRNRDGRLWSGFTSFGSSPTAFTSARRSSGAVSTPAAHSALVDADLFERVQQILARRGDATTRRAATDYLLAGLHTN